MFLLVMEDADRQPRRDSGARARRLRREAEGRPLAALEACVAAARLCRCEQPFSKQLQLAVVGCGCCLSGQRSIDRFAVSVTSPDGLCRLCQRRPEAEYRDMRIAE